MRDPQLTMSGLVDAIVGVIELLLQGAAACALSWYLVSFFHPVSSVVVRYARALWIQAFKKKKLREQLRPVILVVFIASLYAWGVVSNAFNYWVLRPCQDKIILAVERGADAESSFAALGARGTIELVSTRRKYSWPIRERYIEHDAAWRNARLEAHSSILPTLRKFLRIIRGAVVGGALVVGIATLKALAGLIIVFIVGWNPWSLASRYFFSRFVDPRAYDGRASGTEIEPTVQVVGRDLLFPNLVIGALGILLTLTSFLSYVTVESEYQAIVKYGAQRVSSPQTVHD